MENHTFDEQVRQALQNHQTTTNHADKHWDLMEQRLNQVTSPIIEQERIEEEFDNIIRAKMNSRQPTYNPNHWAMMAAKLDQYFSMSAWILRNRVMEIGLTVLFIFTFINVMRHPISLPYYDSKNTNFEKNNHNIVDKKEKIVYQSFNKKIVEKNNIEGKTNLSIEKNTAFAPQKNNDAVILALDNISNKTSDEVANIDVKNKIFVAENINQDISVATIDDMAIKSLAINNIVAFKNIFIKNKKQLSQRSFTFVTAVDNDFIKTPESSYSAFIVPTLNQRQTSVGLGGLFNWQRNRMTFSTGAIYVEKSYQAANVRILTLKDKISTEAITVDLPEVKVNTLQMPFLVNYDFIRKNRLRIGLNVGLTANIITQSKFDYSTQALGFAIRPLPPIEDEPLDKVIKKSSYTDGFFETRSLIGNTFLSNHVGISSQYTILPKWHVFTNAQYKYFFSTRGIGPANDKINTFSIWSGIKKDF